MCYKTNGCLMITVFSITREREQHMILGIVTVVILAAVAVIGGVASVQAVRTDGYRQVPTRY